jgi:hypothetical protein
MAVVQDKGVTAQAGVLSGHRDRCGVIGGARSSADAGGFAASWARPTGLIKSVARVPITRIVSSTARRSR